MYIITCLQVKVFLFLELFYSLEFWKNSHFVNSRLNNIIVLSLKSLYFILFFVVRLGRNVPLIDTIDI